MRELTETHDLVSTLYTSKARGLQIKFTTLKYVYTFIYSALFILTVCHIGGHKSIIATIWEAGTYINNYGLYRHRYSRHA